MTAFSISIVSDTVCPWCYIGAAKLKAGIRAYRAAHPATAATDTFTTTWHPYYLNPSAPAPGTDKTAYYEQKFGERRAATIFATLAAAGADVGIDFKFGGRTGNTRDSHRLIRLAGLKGAEAQTTVVEALFRAYFEHEADISTHAVLEEAGVAAGLERDEVRRCLGTDSGGPEVDLEVEEARGRNISGVPNFTLQGMYEIGGAQEAEDFRRIFEKIKEVESA